MAEGPLDRGRRIGWDHGGIDACVTTGDLRNSLAHEFRSWDVLALDRSPGLHPSGGASW